VESKKLKIKHLYGGASFIGRNENQEKTERNRELISCSDNLGKRFCLKL